MHALSSFLPSYRPNIKVPKRKTKNSNKNSTAVQSPFVIRRFDSPSSPHPYATSPPVFHISEYNADRLSRGYEPSQTPENESLDDEGSERVSFSSRPPLETPRMQLDIDMSGDALTDWIPAHLLASDTPRTPERPLEPPANNTVVVLEPQGPHYDDYDSNEDDLSEYDDEEQASTVSDDIVANLQALDATNFVNNASSPTTRQNGTPAKRIAPTPIKIPNGNIHRPKVQILRSSMISQDLKSRPDSTISMDPNSAISGRTIARALIANSFILSGDKASRYRSGASVLTRQDSATLPRGEHPLLYSPYNRERTLSTGSEMFSPGSRRDSIVPPVPPVPEAFSPPVSRTSPRPPEQPNGASPSAYDSSSGPPTTELSSSPVQYPQPGNFTPSRISRISEAASTDQSLLESQGPTTSVRSLPQPSPLPTETSFPETRPQSQIATPSEPPSTAPSSGIDFENMLDYYQESDTPVNSAPPLVPEINFRPIFSPISEESTSQLSPPTPYRRDSTNRAGGGKLVVVATSSSSSPGGRIEYTMGPRMSRTDQNMRPNLLPIGERPRSTQASPQATHPPPPLNTNGLFNTLYTSDDQSPLVPPPISTIFSRQRTGSAPSPIRVVRDAHGSNSYNITVTPLPEESGAATPGTSEGSEFAAQTFPETPSVFSPTFTPGTVASPGMQAPEYPPTGPSQLTSSASFSGRTVTGPRSNLASQVLLNRAATSIRHSRQGSLGRSRGAAPPIYGAAITEEEEAQEVVVHSRPGSAVIPPEEIREVMGQTADEGEDEDEDPQTVLISSQEPLSKTVAVADTEPSDSPSAYSEAVEINPGPAPPGMIQSSPPSRIAKSANSSQLSLGTNKDKDLPELPPLSATFPPPTPEVGPYHSFPAQAPPSLPQASASTNVPPSPASSSTQSLQYKPSSPHKPMSPRVPAIPTAPTRPPPPPPLFPYTPTTPGSMSGSVGDSTDITPRQPETPPVVVSPPQELELDPRRESSASMRSMEADTPSPFSRAFGSPPAYDTLYDSNQGAITPSTGRSAADAQFVFSPGYPSSPASRESDRRNMSRQSSLARRGRMRPPLPAGPRRPSNQIGPSTSEQHSRRNGSISSVNGPTVNPTRRTLPAAAPLPSPRFHTPAVKWRGYPMDAAKWTFSSSQLQNIVSRAIRQSAEASSIRLLRLETLDNEIPEEIRRLESTRTDVKSKYKLLARRRAEMLDALTWHLTSGRTEDSAAAQRIVEDLKELTVTQDKLAEDLHSADEQMAQINSLRDIHSASALAMALRKLNASFLKQLSECQELRGQIETLEAERDEAWKHAESIASDYDHLHEKVESVASPSYNRRSSRVTASRKSSIRVSKAGLRSARSSVSSHRMSYSTLPSGAKSTFSIEDAPPVPPIPRHRPVDIITDFASRASLGMSTGGTPNSETRAMVRAHEELCDMLGISVHDNRIRRARSVIGRPPEIDPTAAMSIYSDASGFRLASGRPSSLPPASELVDLQNADRHAMLATLGMISSD